MRVKTNMSLGGVLVGGAMGDPGSSTARDETATARSEAIISELFGPLADRVRGTGSHGAYINLLLSSVFLRGCARSDLTRPQPLGPKRSSASCSDRSPTGSAARDRTALTSTFCFPRSSCAAARDPI